MKNIKFIVVANAGFQLKSLNLIGFLTYILVFCGSYSFAQTPFKDITEQAGIKHQFKVFEGFLGGGACVLDINNDGFDDIYLAGGMADDVLYLNNKKGGFTNIYEKSGLIDTKKFITQGAAAADVNRDGFVDLYITTITSKGQKKIIPRAINLLYLNNGNNTFRDATAEFGLGKLNSFSTGASFGDFNADGYPDLYVGNYFTEYPGDLSTINDAMIVSANQITEGYLLLNEKGKSFKNVYKDYGLSHKGFGFGGLFTDFDNDGDQDLFVNHDFGYKRTPDLLFKNEYPWHEFRDVSKETAMDLKINSMASAVGDYNNDGWMDYFITNIRFNKFMVNNGVGKPFVEKSREVGLGFITISWGANFADFDHDGDLDLFVANGDLNPNCVPMGDYYLENINGRFEEKGRLMGVSDYGIGRGSIVFDLENDGDLDILVVNQEPILTGYPVASTTHLFRNDSAKGNWIKIALKGVDAESHGLASRVEIVVDGKHQIREIDGGGSSHLSQNATFAHFGVGNATQIDEIIVHWTGGEKQVLKNQKVNQTITITEEKHFAIWSILKWILLALGLLAGVWYFWRRNK
ncbi:CRTAC1 family protein [Emticicia aquatilis]|nr:CRTAC1 family protein [Emticicia aquatilis]